ncbi:hypothetical protein [Burkholderia cepacia]|uniref:hypothetical protein n=1 Tax=Burkholderia cepacia TaxID=292 RepID=UPI0012D8D23B|nr:hypothetical protein [Burkholderia cepacia]
MRDASGLDWNSGRRKMRRGSGEVYAKLPVAADAMRVCPGTAAAVSLMQRKPDRGRLAPAVRGSTGFGRAAGVTRSTGHPVMRRRDHVTT